MTGLQGMDPKMIRQYSSAYGEFIAGDYAIGEQLHTRHVSGEVLWSYRQPLHGLTYVVDDTSGWPVEVLAREVQAR